MGAFIADSFHLEAAPASKSDTLADLVAQWDAANVTCRAATEAHNAAADAMGRRGLNYLAVIVTLFEGAAYPVKVHGRKGLEEFLESNRTKYNWFPGGFERLREESIARFESAEQAWNDADQAIGYRKAETALSVAERVEDDLMKRISAAVPVSIEDVLAKLRFARLYAIRWADRDDDSYEVEAIDSVIGFLAAQAMA